MSKKKTILQIEAPSPTPGKYDYDVEGGNLPKLVGKVLSFFVVSSNLKFFFQKLVCFLCQFRVNFLRSDTTLKLFFCVPGSPSSDNI